MCICTTSLPIHSSVDGHLGCFHVLAIINNTSVNTGPKFFNSSLNSLNFFFFPFGKVVFEERLLDLVMFEVSHVCVC